MFGPIKRRPKEKEDPAEKEREQEETARVYAEFVKSFQVEDNAPKKFIRGGVIDPNKTLGFDAEPPTVEKAKPYKSSSTKRSLWLPPSSESLQARQSLQAQMRANTSSGSTSDAGGHRSATHTTVQTELGRGIGGIEGLTSSGFGSSSSQRTREIDTFLEEIKRKQELVDQRKQLRQVANSAGVEESERESAKQKLEFIESQTRGRGSIPGLVEAEETTNLYLGNLSPEITEEFLCQQFGRYGNVTSVKIMYPRSEEERARRRHCGFVSFETREMAEAAKDALDGEEFFGMLIRIGWGKAVSRPNLTPAPLTAGVAALAGLPVVGGKVKGLEQHPHHHSVGFSDVPPERAHANVVVKVQIPKNKRQKAVIDLVAQYVAEEGYAFEQLLTEKYKNDELFQFLVEKESDMANYYRWRVYASTQGDTTKAWRTEPYCMFAGGKEWHPPGPECFDEAVSRRGDKRSNFSDRADAGFRDANGTDSYRQGKGNTVRGGRRLDEDKREELEDILRNLTRERESILNAMVFCLDHSDYALEVSECLMESLTIEKTPIDTKIARLYLLSDILHNLSCSRQPAWAYRGALERYLPEIFTHHNRVLKGLTGKLTIQAMKDRVMSVLRIWEDWAIYPPMFTKGLEASFLKEDKLLADVFSSAVAPLPTTHELFEEELDGKPLPDGPTLAKFPFWLRENVREWNSLDLSHLERLCIRAGLSVSPEPLTPEEEEKLWASENHTTSRIEEGSSEEDTHRGDANDSSSDRQRVATKTARPDLSYQRMRQLLIKRLVECEAYWRNRQIQNAKAFQVLDRPEHDASVPTPQALA